MVGLWLTSFSPHPPLFEDVRGFETLTIRDTVPKATTSMVTVFPNKVVRPETRSNACTPLSEWESLTPRGIPPEMQLRSRPTTSSKIAVARSSTLELTRFQRFIRRMESAGPRVVLDRLKEEWQDPPGEEVDEEVRSTRYMLQDIS
jgi:hypothetical protein